MVIEAKNSAGIRRFSYNSRHQQTRVETETGSVQENRYDAEGLRFELLENGRRTSFVYHDGELLQEEGREEQGTSYHLGAGMEAFRRGQELYYYHKDEQLSTALVTDGHRNVQNSYQYDAFGMSLGTTEKLNNRIRYTGQQYDDVTGQYYLRARYYNPVAGCFMQEDVYQGDGLNLYAYCGNNPVVYDDPSGYASTSTGKACPPQGKISESVDETSYGKSSSNCTELAPYYPANNGAESGTPSTTDRIRNVAQQSFDYAVNNPRKQGLNRMQLGKDAEIQATRWTRKWAERNGIDLSESGLHFQVRGEHSIPDVVYEPTKNIMDFKLTPKAVRKKQSDNFKSDFPGYSIEYIFGPGPWREQDEH